ncbi:hypothetical protein [Salmonella enterica]|uniref:hypothetical protein n=1 Tax=Salmonella enterica TaxID=28901 RepID=UPI0009B04EFB|nr:hypothetical protein [Salmonella enterica]
MTTITKKRAEIKSFITGLLSDPAHDNQSSDSLLANVFRIALASLEAEPVAWTDEEELRDVRKYGFGEIFQCPPDKYADPRRVIPLYRVPDGMHELYAAQPAPVVPEEMNFSTACNFVQINGIANEDRATLAMRTWNACRDAMLNGGKS